MSLWTVEPDTETPHPCGSTNSWRSTVLGPVLSEGSEIMTVSLSLLHKKLPGPLNGLWSSTRGRTLEIPSKLNFLQQTLFIDFLTRLVSDWRSPELLVTIGLRLNPSSQNQPGMGLYHQTSADGTMFTELLTSITKTNVIIMLVVVSLSAVPFTTHELSWTICQFHYALRPFLRNLDSNLRPRDYKTASLTTRLP